MDYELTIEEVESGRRRYMALLLEGDESAAMIDRYLDCGRLFVGHVDGEDVAVCVCVADGGDVEVKNLAVDPRYRRRGIGRRMLAHVESLYPGGRIKLGTGETPSTLRFYRSCGYEYSHRIARFFTDNYPHPIVEDGVTLRDMLYLVKKL